MWQMYLVGLKMLGVIEVWIVVIDNYETIGDCVFVWRMKMMRWIDFV